MLIEIRIDGLLKQTEAELEAIGRKLENKPALLAQIGVALRKTTLERFDTETDPDGKKWEALTAFTTSIRKKPNSKILSQSGNLKRSITYHIYGDTLKLGPNTIYAAVQQWGATIKPKTAGGRLAIPVPAGRGKKRANQDGVAYAKSVTIPARPYIGFGDKDREAAERAITRYLGLSR